MLESLFNKVVTLNFIKRRLQHRCFLLNFLEIIKSTYFVEYLQRALLPIAVSAVENVLTFGFHFGGCWTFAWINNKLMLHFLHKVRQIDVINLTYLHKVGEIHVTNLTYFFITLCLCFALLASLVFLNLWSKIYLA